MDSKQQFGCEIKVENSSFMWHKHMNELKDECEFSVRL